MLPDCKHTGIRKAFQQIRVVLLFLHLGEKFLHLELSINMAGDHVPGFASLKFVHGGLLCLHRVGQGHKDELMSQAVHDASINEHFFAGDVLIVPFVVIQKVIG